VVKQLIFSRLAALLVIALASVALVTCNKAADSNAPLSNEEKLLNIDRTLLREKLTRVCIASVVNLNSDQAAAGGAPAATGEAAVDPKALEREVLESMSSYIVGNTRFTVFAAPDEMEKKARELIVARNANVIPAQQARELAATAGVDCIITVSVETDGKRVNFAVYSGETGRTLYSETLVDWDFSLVKPAEAAAGG
jgi:hypothetical protein